MLSWQTLNRIRNALSLSQNFQTTIDVNANGATFVEAARDVNLNFGDRCREGMKILCDNVVSAFHDAAERGDPPKCHPKTRVKILDEIMQWIKDPPAFRMFVLWLYGPAGAGKSAIAQTIAEICATEGLLAASFFFSRTVEGRNTSSHFIATIAYQLCISIPGLRDYISAAVENDPAIFKRTVTKQMHALILKPITDALADGKQVHTTDILPQLVLVDGLDECKKESEQEEILDILAASYEILQRVPLVFLVASRPEYTIRTCFNQGALANMMRGTPLDYNYRPDDDIKIFLRDTFDDIRQRHPLGDKLPCPWPTEYQLNDLVWKASGQFIYAATVTNFVDSRHHNPSKRLDVIFQDLPSTSRTRKDVPFAQLDALYRQILSSVQDLPNVMDILTFIVLDSTKEVKTLEFILDLDEGEIESILQDMHALIQLEQPDTTLQSLGRTHYLRLHHASFSDFLMDRSRSEQYFLDTQKGYTKLAISWLKMMNSKGNFAIREQDLYQEWLIFQGKLSRFTYYCKKGTNTPELSSALVQFDLPAYMRAIHTNVITGYGVHTWETFLECAERLVSSSLKETFKRQIFDFSVEKLDKCPEPLRSCMRAAVCISSQWAPSDLFLGVLLSFKLSLSAYKRIADYDLEIFGFLQSSYHSKDLMDEDGICNLLSGMLQDPTQAGRFFVDGDTFCQLAFRLVKHMLQRITIDDIERRISWVQLQAHRGYGPRCWTLSYDFLSEILPRCSNSAKLASNLQTMLIHADRIDQSYATITLLNSCIEYMKRCHDDDSVPFTHQFPSLFRSTVAEDGASLQEFRRALKSTVEANRGLTKSLLEQKAEDDRYADDKGIEEYTWDPEITIKPTWTVPAQLNHSC